MLKLMGHINLNIIGIRIFILKGTSTNSILFHNLGFFQATVLPKYSFSDAKLRFWCLISEKNTCVGIPIGINRGALKNEA